MLFGCVKLYYMHVVISFLVVMISNTRLVLTIEENPSLVRQPPYCLGRVVCD